MPAITLDDRRVPLGFEPPISVKAPEGPKGMDVFEDKKIPVTPYEERTDKAVDACAKEPLMPSNYELIDDAIHLGIKPKGDDFSFEKMIESIASTEVRLAAMKREEREELQRKIAAIQTRYAETLASKPAMGFEELQSRYFKETFALLESYDSVLASSMLSLRNEISKMSKERQREFQEMYARQAEGRTVEWVGLGATAIAGAIAAMAIGTGWGAIAIGAAAFAAFALQSDSLFGDPVKHAVATVGAGDDHQLIQDRMANLRQASSIVTFGCTALSIALGADAIAAGSIELLLKASQIVTGASMISVTASEARNTKNKAHIQELDHDIEHDERKMEEEQQQLRDSASRLQEFIRHRKQTLRGEHEAMMTILKQER